METTQTIKTEDEKMVPIDTSGNAVDVELKDEVKQESNEESNVKVVEETTEETPVQETSEGELEEYSTGVKKRIDKLTEKRS
jgi:flagellar basal body rod protein FlgG